MKLHNMRLKNYRCFGDMTVELHPGLTVFVANNGCGKTTIMDAIRVAVWPFIKSFELAQTSTFKERGNGISIDDVMLKKLENGSMARQLPAEIIATGEWDFGITKTWSRSRVSERARTKTRNDDTAKSLEIYANAKQEQIRTPDKPELGLPMLGYYGTGRLWAQKRLTEKTRSTKKDNSFYVRSFGYQNCMDPASSYKHFKEWFIWAWNSWVNATVRASASPEEKETTRIRVIMVQSAVNSVLKEATGWHTLEYSIEDQESLILSHERHGRVKVDQMSDGIRSIVALVGDIAYRCIKLNPQFGSTALQETNGIVLIDEVDMHLHPAWQQTVVGALRVAFPKIQFIITTHSPQVLSTVPKECIRVLGLNSEGGDIAAIPLAASYGEPSNDVLQAIMHVDPQSPVPEKHLLKNKKTAQGNRVPHSALEHQGET